MEKVLRVTFIVFLLATSPMSLSLVNEAQYLMINHASVELVHNLMRSRFEYHDISFKNSGKKKRTEHTKSYFGNNKSVKSKAFYKK